MRRSSGAPIVEPLARDGFAVTGCGVVAGSDCAPHAEVDVVDRRALREFVARVDDELGPPAVVVTAAGIQRTGASEAVGGAGRR